MKRWLALLIGGAIFLGFLGCGAPLSTESMPGTTQGSSPAVTHRPTASNTQAQPAPPTHAVTVPTQPTTVPTQPTTAPTQPTTVPTQPTTVPTQPTTAPTQPTTVPTQPTTVPTQPTTAPTQPTTAPTQPTTAPTQPTTPPTPPPDPSKQWVISGYSSVNMRKEPSSDATVLVRLAEGTVVHLRYWTGKYACVEYNGQRGFVMASYLRPADPDYMTDALDTVELTDKYSYDQMMEDLVHFHQTYPDQVELEIIGYSELGNQIPVLRIGNPNAEYHVLIQGAIHGREHMTAWLVMALADYWLDQDLASHGDVCYHLIPMINPDGVIISQTGQLTAEQLLIYHADRQKGYTYLAQRDYAALWKANGLGVDLNRNFPTGWDLITDRENPSSRNYKGTEPFSAAETRALRDYTLSNDFDATITYHAMGCVIYYDYGNKQPVNRQSADLARKVLNVTGYYMIASGGNSHAGYKDWAIDALGIPSLTIEVGCENTPLAKRELYSTFVRNRDVIPAIAAWLQR